jgi:hypothetical protein
MRKRSMPRRPVAFEPHESHRRYARPVAGALFAVGIVYLVGTLVDLGTLWLLQRQSGMEWEFVAVTSTADALPRFIFAVAALYLAFYVGGSRVTWLYRSMSIGLLALGVIAIGLGALSGTNYLALARVVNPEAEPLLRSSVIKTLALCTLYAVVLIPVGISGLHARRSKK